MRYLDDRCDFCYELLEDCTCDEDDLTVDWYPCGCCTCCGCTCHIDSEE